MDASSWQFISLMAHAHIQLRQQTAAVALFNLQARLQAAGGPSAASLVAPPELQSGTQKAAAGCGDRTGTDRSWPMPLLLLLLPLLLLGTSSWRPIGGR
jgi:hypothetical protein